ncbi:MAG: DNA translocase FtsK, partial [bacterium]|nr:DNA translocase FtsK [bacterium]
MARKAIKRLRENKKDEEAENYAGPALTPETRRGIGVILLFALGILSVFSLFNLAGSVGQFIETILRQTFGWAAYVIPVIFLWWGYLLLRAVEKPLSITTYVGFGLSVVSITALFHIFIPFDEAISSISAGRGGGYLGFIFSYPFQRIMGFWAALVLVVALFCIAILILFNTSLERLAEHRGALGQMAEKLRNGLRWFKRETDDTEGEIEAEEEVMEPDEEESDDEEKEVFKHNPVADSEHGDAEPAAKDNAPARRHKKIDIPLDLLEKKMAQPTSGDIGGNTEKIRKTLGNFGVHVEMGDVRVGPTVTQYTFRPAEGVKLSQITGLGNDLALALAAHPIRIEAPIPGKSLVGVEVPNHKIAPVGLRGILESPEFKKRTGNLTVGLGRDVAGNVVLANLESMPHLLIAGATGSGKSVGIHNLIISMLYQNSPDMLRFILVDPKKVELTSYSGIPHLMTPVITEVAKIVNALRWCIAEMDRRYQLLSEHNKKNITLYNGSVLVNKLPYIVVIIDELADLMSQAAQEVEAMIIRLAQMARAVGIHLVVSTQRPSVDVITGLIKANITTRIAFSVASQMDSRTILD